MRSLFGIPAALLAICAMLPADAQDSSRLGQPTTSSVNPPAMQTGKERLGSKWMDEQRIDNCR